MKHAHDAWYYGPKGEHLLVKAGDEVPTGYLDHPSKHKAVPEKQIAAEKEKLDKGLSDQTTGTTKATGAGGNSQGAAPGDDHKLDAHGHKWDISIHAKTQSMTNDNLWRMAPGKSRPAPVPGYPKADGAEAMTERENPDHEEKPVLDL